MADNVTLGNRFLYALATDIENAQLIWGQIQTRKTADKSAILAMKTVDDDHVFMLNSKISEEVLYDFQKRILQDILTWEETDIFPLILNKNTNALLFNLENASNRTSHSEHFFVTLLTVIAGFSQEKIQDIFLQVNADGRNALCYAAQNGYLDLLLPLVKGFKLPVIRKILTHTHRRNNILMIALGERSLDIPELLNILKSLDEPSRASIFKQCSSLGNALAIAVLYYPEIVPELCRFLRETLTSKDITEILLQVDATGRNALLIAAESNKEVLLPLLDLLATLEIEDQAKILRHYSEGSLLTRVLFPPQGDIAEKILGRIEQMSQAEQAVILRQTHAELQANPLMGVLSAPKLFPRMLALIKGLKPEDQRVILMQWDSKNRSVSMIALENSALLPLLEALDDSGKSAVLTQVCQAGQNILQYAITRDYKTALGVLEVIKKMDPILKAQILIQSNSKSTGILKLDLWYGEGALIRPCLAEVQKFPLESQQKFFEPMRDFFQEKPTGLIGSQEALYREMRTAWKAYNKLLHPSEGGCFSFFRRKKKSPGETVISHDVEITPENSKAWMSVT